MGEICARKNSLFEHFSCSENNMEYNIVRYIYVYL